MTRARPARSLRSTRIALAALALGLSACTPGAGSAGTKSAPVVVTPTHAPAAGAAWIYDVVATANGGELDVTARFPDGSAATLSLDDGAAPFVANLTVEGANAGAAQAGVWTLPTCAHGCTLRYRFHLADAARALGDLDTAAASDECLESPPSVWLLRPTEHADATTYRFHVTTGAGFRFATGVHAVAGVADTYGAQADDLDSAPYSVFGPFRSRTLARMNGASAIELAILPGRLTLDDAAIDHWVNLSADAIEAYYGRFPVARVLLVLVPGEHGGGGGGGRTLASGGSSIVMSVGAAMSNKDIPRDWVLTHEMTHLALPTLRRDHHWLEEGLATYIEPIARAMVGTIPPREVWEGLVGGLPNGEPAEGDEGLDRTHTWGRTYWGGALFSLVADLEIRKATGNEKSLENALRGILAAGGNGETRWPLADVLRQGDKAIGAPVLEELHAKWGSAPVKVDLAKLWRELGVYGTGHAVYLENDAPLADVRRAMTVAAGK